MLKRPALAEGLVPKSSQPPTIPAGDIANPNPPFKLPKLVPSPPLLVSGGENTNQDAFPTPTQHPVPVTTSANYSKNEEPHSKEETVIMNSQENTKSPGCEIKTPKVETLKNSAKCSSWASNYLSSIGLSYRKPIKINLSSTKNLNVNTAEPSQSNITAEKKKAESENFNEYSVQQQSHSGVIVNDVLIPTMIPIYSPELKTHNENYLISKTNFNDNEKFFVPETNLLPCFNDLHPETLHIANENLFYLNCCSRRYHSEQLLCEKTSLTECDKCKNISRYRPAEDISYLNKVDQFLAKISKDKGEIAPHGEVNTRKRSLSPIHRGIEKNIKSNIEKQHDTKIVDFGTARSSDIPVNKNKRVEHVEKDMKMPKIINNAVINEKPSTSKCKYYDYKQMKYVDVPTSRTANMKLEDKYKTRDKYSVSRAEYLPTRSPNRVHRYQEIEMYETRQKSYSSSCSDRGRSPLHNKHNHIMHNEKVSHDSNNRSENCQKYTRQSREICNSSSHKNWDRSARHISYDTKYKPKNRPRSNSKSSNHSGKLRDRSSRQSQTSQEDKGRTIKRRKSYSSSDSSSPCHDRIAQRNKSYKRKKTCSSSSSSSSSSSGSSSDESDNFQDTSVRHSHKIGVNKKHMSKQKRKEKCCKSCSKNIRDKTNAEKCHVNKSKSCERGKCFETCAKSQVSPDAKKTYKLIKDIISKDKVKRKLIKSLFFKNSNANEKNSKTSSVLNSKQRTKIPSSSEKCSRKKHGEDEESKSRKSAPIKSTVQVKDRIQQNRRNNSSETEMDNFDLRSKLSRKNLSQYMNEIRNKNNNNVEKELSTRENLVITVDNKDQKETFKTDSDKLIDQEETENLKLNKYKKIKLVINVICESSDDDEKEAIKAINDDDTNVDKECVLSNEELNFLDDLNIDEIVNSLTHNKNEPSSSNCADATIENKIVIDLCDLISSTEDSDASTVYLEELCGMHDSHKDPNNPKKKNIKNGDITIKNNNQNYQNERIDMIPEKLNSEDLAKTSDKIETFNQNTLVTENGIKQENESSVINNTNKQNVITCNLTHINNTMSALLKTEKDKLVTNEIKEKSLMNNNHKQNSIIPLIEIKDEPVMCNYILKHVSNNITSETDCKKEHEDQVRIKKIKTKEGKMKIIENTDNKLVFTNEIKERSVTNNNHEQNSIISLIEIKDEPVMCNYKLKHVSNNITSETDGKKKHEDQVRNKKIKTKEGKMKNIENTDIKLGFTSEIKERSVINNNNKQNSIISLIEIKDEPVKCNYKLKQASNNITPEPETDGKKEPEDQVRNKKIKSKDGNMKNIAYKLASENEIKKTRDFDNNLTVTEIKDEPMDEMENKEINQPENETTFSIEGIVSASDKTKIEMTDEYAKKISSNKSSPQVIKNMFSCPRDVNNKNTVNTSVIELEDKPKSEMQSVKIKTPEKFEQTLISANEIKTEMPDEDAKKGLSNRASPQVIINNASYPRGRGIMKDHLNVQSKTSVGIITSESEKEIAADITEVNKKITDNVDIFENKSCTSNSEKVIRNQQNNSTEAIVKVTTSNKTSIQYSAITSKTIDLPTELVDNKELANNVINISNNGSIVQVEKVLDDTSAKVCNKTVISACHTENTDSVHFNNTDSQIPREMPSNNSLPNNINSTTDVLNSTEHSKKLQVLKKLSEKVTENNALEIEPIKKIGDIVSVGLNNSQNINTNNVAKEPKSDKKKITLINNQECNDSKKNYVADAETASKSRSHSPIRVKTPQPIIKPEKKPGNIGKNLVETLESRLLEYLHEPFTVTSLIHRGKYSKIFQCKCSLGKDYIVKMLSYEKGGCPKGIIKQKFLQFLQMDIPTENLNIVRVIDGLSVSGQWCLLMDFYPKNLSQYLKENGRSLHVDHVQHLSRQLVAAVTALRHKNVVHSDIKPGHILLNSTNDRLKLCGFDGAYYVGQVDVLPNIGSVNYRAPELIIGHSAGYSIDVWSTALVMFEMATRRLLFPGHFNNDILFKQMCTVGFVPIDMINQSRFAYNHFSGTLFMRRSLGQPHSYTLLGESQIYRNNILRSTVNSTYHKEWAKGIRIQQQTEELRQIDNFCNLLEEMLTIHPTNRPPIEFVYTNRFVPYLSCS